MLGCGVEIHRMGACAELEHTIQTVPEYTQPAHLAASNGELELVGVVSGPDGGQSLK
jgi:hypothetical protein